jgi:hypothetical protein
MSDEPDQPANQPQIIIQPEQMAGVWANFAQVSHSEHEFTLDFVRMDYGTGQGIVVARVSVSPLFITQLQAAIEANWQKYAEKALPKEARDDP